MYIPQHFRCSEREKSVAFAKHNAFATLVTHTGEYPFASHLPLLLEEDKNLRLLGHMAKANEQWQHFQGASEVLVVFQGPHAYISPTHYTAPGVPTWNYAAVHMYGKCTIIDDKKRLKNIIESLTNRYEASQNSPWAPVYPEDMLSAIVGFEMLVDRIEAKYKLSQNRPHADKKNIIHNLSQSSDQHASELAQLMRDNEF